MVLGAATAWGLMGTVARYLLPGGAMVVTGVIRVQQRWAAPIEARNMVMGRGRWVSRDEV